MQQTSRRDGGGLVLGADWAGGEKIADVFLHGGPPEAFFVECLGALDSRVAGYSGGVAPLQNRWTAGTGSLTCHSWARSEGESELEVGKEQ